jgi:hypothetical protein
MSVYTLLQLNNQYYETDGFIDATTANNPAGPTYINNATGQIQVLGPNGSPLVIGPAGATISPLAYVAGSNGIYRALITAVFTPATGGSYTIVVDLTGPGAVPYHRELLAQVEVGRGG